MMKRKKTGGRKLGTLNKASAEIKEIARQYGPQAIETLVQIMHGSTNDQTRISAAKELLDRGFGKPTQELGVVDDQGIKAMVYPPLPVYEAALKQALREY